MLARTSSESQALKVLLSSCKERYGDLSQGGAAEEFWSWPGEQARAAFCLFRRDWESDVLGESRWGLKWAAGLSRDDLNEAALCLPGLFEELEAASVCVRIPMAQHPFVQLAESAGFTYSGGLVSLATTPVASSANSQIAKESPRPVCKGELAQLEEIAFTAFKEGRFYHERGLRDGAAQQIYSAWAKNGVNYADEVWVTGKEVVTGFLTLKRDERNKRLWIDLIAVAPHAQGSGLGSVLVARSFESARQLKGWTLGVKTEPENLGALRFYLRNGLELESFQLDYSWRCSCAGSARTR